VHGWGHNTLSALSSIAIIVAAALLAAALIAALLPSLKRFALARPNVRSSHSAPTPQGGGIAVVIATLAVVGVALTFTSIASSAIVSLPIVAFAIVVMTCLGAIDDVRPLPVTPRFVLQAVVVAAVLYAVPEQLRVIPALPWWLERCLLLIGGLWFVNLVNFMDGIDWMTVAEVVPLTATLAVIGFADALPAYATALSLALVGAMIGFAYFNKPTARIFLGDVGSLPIGLMLGFLLLLVAGAGHLIAALIAPLYYLADTTVTLLRRAARGEQILRAHRTHFYQRATDNGFTSMGIVTRVFAVNIGLGALSVTTVLVPGTITGIAALIAGIILVTWLLFAFAQGKK
jgi:UDP-N-acetylmuramyl pentapeptide phosphotransferase/UDP-N-acetylglucosamine-1-phosphate transferase